VSREADRNTETSTRVVDVFSPAVTGRACFARETTHGAGIGHRGARQKALFLGNDGEAQKKGQCPPRARSRQTTACYPRRRRPPRERCFVRCADVSPRRPR
jgi:hypothetical protein